MDLFSLKGRKALVTGGNSGIGLGLATGLAQAGAAVAITGRDPRKLEAALKALRAIEPACEAFDADLAHTTQLPAVFERIERAMGGLDVLVNNAGTTFRGRADQTPIEEWSRVLNLNLTTPYVLSQCFARARMGANKSGSIIMTGSLMCEASRPTTSAYTASKGGIRQLIKALAVDWAPFAIRVNGIGPGYIDTPMTVPLTSNAEFDAWVKKRTPLGRWGQPDDFRGAAVFLASEASAFVTGQIIYVDGGWLATF